MPKHDNELDYIAVNSCRGLICLRDYFSYNPCVVANPVTGEYIRLPKFDQKNNLYSKESALGYCECSNHFKVLRIFETRVPQTEHVTVCHTNAEILTVGSDLWRPIGNVPFRWCKLFYPTYKNGVIHWFVFDSRLVVSDMKNTTLF